MTSTNYASSVELQERCHQGPPQLSQLNPQLVRLPSISNEASRDVEIVQQQLDQADGGVAAWRLLGAAFVFEALFWGTTAPLVRRF